MSNFFKIAGLSKAHSQVVRAIEARTYATAKVEATAHFTGAVAAGAAHRQASNIAKSFIEPAVETTTEGFMAKQGTAMGFAVQHVAPALAAVLAGAAVDAGVQAIGRFFINRAESTSLKEHINSGAVVLVESESPAYKQAVDEGNAFASVYSLKGPVETKATAVPSVVTQEAAAAAPAAAAAAAAADIKVS